NVKDRAEETVASAGQTATEIKNKAQEGAHHVMHKAGEVASDVAHKAGELASSTAQTVGKKADEAASAVGERMSSLAGTIREKAPHGGVLGQAASTVASGLESGGTYLKEQGLSGAWEDLTTLVRRYPMPALLLALGAGFLVARATTTNRG